MNIERDELIQIIWDGAVADRVKDGKDLRNVPVIRPKVEALADAILDAGYFKPRTIATIDELDGLPVGTVVIDGAGAGEVYRKLARAEGVKWYEPSYAIHWESHEINLPALAIWDTRP